jgi:hypothetical protein
VLLVHRVAKQVEQHRALAGDDGRCGRGAVELAGELVEDAAQHVRIGEVCERNCVALGPADRRGQVCGQAGFPELGVGGSG